VKEKGRTCRRDSRFAQMGRHVPPKRFPIENTDKVGVAPCRSRVVSYLRPKVLVNEGSPVLLPKIQIFSLVHIARFHSFGTRSVLLTMAAAQAAKMKLTMCTSPRPPSLPHSITVPKGIPSLPSTHPFLAQYDNIPISPNDEGMGSPSKYFALPFSLGTRATVALKRASRARPQQMKPVRTTVSR